MLIRTLTLVDRESWLLMAKEAHLYGLVIGSLVCCLAAATMTRGMNLRGGRRHSVGMNSPW